MSELSVTAALQYLVATGERPIYYASRPGADAALKVGAQFEQHRVRIGDGRGLESCGLLDREGFTLREHAASVHDFYHPDFDQALYEKQLSELVLSVTGGTDTLVFDHTRRSDSAKVRGQRLTRETASIIHNDYTDGSARKRVVDMLGVEAAEQRLQKRFAIVNVWRSISGTVWNSPLALCDAATLASADLIASERRAEERIGELELVSWNPEHRWYYYPEMSESELLLFKTYDSRTDGSARRSVHTAFDNPLAPKGSPPRESIESRLLVFFS